MKIIAEDTAAAVTAIITAKKITAKEITAIIIAAATAEDAAAVNLFFYTEPSGRKKLAAFLFFERNIKICEV